MKSVKTNKLGRRILSFVLTATLVVGLVPGNVLTASAEESNATAPSVTAFATPEQLMSSYNFALHTDYAGVAQKVYFGINGESQQTWYIAGSDAADSIVLLCDPVLPMAISTEFEDDYSTNKTYDNSWNCTYGTPPSEVYPNHYGASDLRGALQGYTSNDNTEKFSAAEKELMQSTKVYTDDAKLKDEGETNYTYYTEDVLYPAYGEFFDDQYITVGANSADSLNGGLKVSLKSAPYNGGDIFWLRAPDYDDSTYTLIAYPGFFVSNASVIDEELVVPAFRLNLSSVLFASAATAATSDASLTDTMTFRVDGAEKLASGAAYATCGVTVNYDEGDGNVFLYVQDADSVYSVEITEDTTLALSDMTGINNLTDENTKIWLEKSEDNVAYAVMAEALLTEHIPNADDGDCTTAITCSVCGEVTTEAKATHTPNADDGDCTTAITCSVCGTVTTEAKATHTPNADDGDCTTAITCSVCGTVTTEAGHIDANGDEYCDNCGVIYNGIGAHLAGYSVSLNGSIGVNFHMDLTQDVLDDNDAYMLFTLPNGTTQKVMVSDAKAKESTVIEGKTYYIFTCNVAAKEMTDTIQAQLITSDGSKTQVYKYSVREYADRILSGSYDYETLDLVKAMLHYGAYSQEWFGYNTTNLANAELEALDLSEADDWDGFDPIITNDEKVGSFTSAYLTLESDTAINLKFKLADGVSFEDLRVVVQDPMAKVVPVTTDTTENVCLITLTGIKASDLDTTYSFSVTDGDGNKSTILYSAMSYACAVADSEMDQKLKDVTAALRIFNIKANEKFE